MRNISNSNQLQVTVLRSSIEKFNTNKKEYSNIYLCENAS